MVDIVQCYCPRRDKWETEFSLPEALGGIRACTLILPRGQVGPIATTSAPGGLVPASAPKAPTTPVGSTDGGVNQAMPASASVAQISQSILELPSSQRYVVILCAFLKSRQKPVVKC